MEKAGKISSLQGLRFLAFIGIFIWHLDGYMGIKSYNLAFISVTFFFMLSGFVSVLNINKYLDKSDNIVIKSFNYAKNKMSRIYGLYILVILLYAPLSFKHLVIDSNIDLFTYAVCFIINLLLLETWIPNKCISIAHAGWYMSDLFFLNLVTIPIAWISSKFNKKNRIITDILYIVLGFAVLYIYCSLVTAKKSYFLYYFPLFRIIEYFIGMTLGRIYLKYRRHKFDNIMCSIVEIVVVILIAMIINTIKTLEFGFNSISLFIIISSMLLLIFSLSKGIISRMLSNKVLVFLGDISGELYLIHILTVSYILGILQIIFPHTLFYTIFAVALTFLMTVYISYFIHYKKYIGFKIYIKINELNKKAIKEIKNRLIRFIGNFKKKNFKDTNFTIISNNCFAGIVYRNNNIPYQSPTCGLFIMPDDYIKFIYNIKEYLKGDLKQIQVNESKYKSYLEEINYAGTIGKINDIEIMFLHYRNFDEAREKWYRRIKRINWKKVIYKFNDQNGCTYDNLKDFQNFNVPNKILFTAKKYDGIDSIVFYEFESIGYVENDSSEKVFKKYFNIYEYINRI